MKPSLIMLVGLPASGKTTFLRKYVESLKPEEYVILSTDDYIENSAKTLGKEYNDVFKDTIDEAEKSLRLGLKDAIQDRIRYIFWDQTNLTVKTRAKKLALFSELLAEHAPFQHYERHVWYFPIPEKQEWLKRLNSRLGKHISHNVLFSMMLTLEPPRATEGFVMVCSEFNLNGVR